MTSRAPGPPRSCGPADVDRCERLLADHLAAAVQRFGAAALGVVDLPPLDEPDRPSAAQLRAAATLLWARHVDEAGLLDFTDALAGHKAEAQDSFG